MINSFNLYQTSSANILKSACLMLQKCYQEKMKTLVLTKNHEMSIALDNTLWTFAQKSFIPHALYTDEMFDEHPIIISDQGIIEANFTALVLIERFDIAPNTISPDKLKEDKKSPNIIPNNYSKVMCFIDAPDKSAAIAFRALQQYQNTNYYTQGSDNRWSAII